MNVAEFPLYVYHATLSDTICRDQKEMIQLHTIVSNGYVMKIADFPTYEITLFCGDALSFYESWDAPVVIVSDGPYGVGGYPGDPHSHHELADWYEPHISAWSEKATPETTLWFWNTEVGWATVHPIIERYGWEYRECNIWNKGMAHVAGNSNTKVIRKFPVVTEVCVHYVKKPSFSVVDKSMSMQEWLRYEWQRTGIPLSKTNEACGVKSAATRKYFTTDHLWYFPPAEAFDKFASYANTYGSSRGKPYFSIDGEKPISKEHWARMRAKFYCPMGVTNVWDVPTVNGNERLKAGSKALHLNQKPIKLMELVISVSSDEGDLVWEPFGGLFTGALASRNLGRKCVASELSPDVFAHGIRRLSQRQLL